jgi:Beta-galactosidase trimerisation domain
MRRLSRTLIATLALGVAVPVAATAATVPPIAPFSFPEDGVRLPAGARGAVAVVALPNDPIGPGTEYEALQIMGVPAAVVSLGVDLTQYRVVILAGTADGGSVDDAAIKALTSYVEGGGVLIAEAVTAQSLRPLFGIEAVVESNTRETITLCAACHPSLSDVSTTSERKIELDDTQGGAGIGTVGYRPVAGAQVLGSFADGTAALLAHNQGAGATYAVGARLLDLVARHWEGARFSARREFRNTAEADTDAWLLWLRGVWRATGNGGVTLSTMPAGVSAQVLLTISANWGDGMLQVPSYLRAIRAIEPGAGSTVFVATRTANDWLDDAFFPTPGLIDPRTGRISGAAETAVSLGAELGSHSVSHTPRFGKLGLGTGLETWGDYAPFIKDRDTTEGATLLGELLVSRALLRSFQPDVPSFRSPFLLSSRALAPAQDAVGYRFDSSTTQGWVQTAFPFHPPRLDDRGFADVSSFPITVEDEADGGLRKRVGSAVEIASAAINNGAPATILIHPRAEDDWREGAVDLIAGLRKKYGSGLSVDSIATYGTFWAQRDRLALMTGRSPNACGGKGGVSVSVANRGRVAAERQALSISDPKFTRVTFFNGPTAGEVAIKNGIAFLPRLNPGRSATGVLCP